MANDSSLFMTTEMLLAAGWSRTGAFFVRDGEKYEPLLEPKMLHQYNHRHGDFAYVASGKRAHILPNAPSQRLQDPTYEVTPHYWVPSKEITKRLGAFADKTWVFGWREVTDARASARTMILCAVPPFGFSHKFPLILSTNPESWALYTYLNSLVADYAARQKVAGLSLSMFTLRQIPVPAPGTLHEPQPWLEGGQTIVEWLRPRVGELTYTSQSMKGLSKALGTGNEPYVWDAHRRRVLRAEIDAAFFFLALWPDPQTGSWRRAPEETRADFASLATTFPTPRDAVQHILNTFSVLRRREESEFGEFVTARMVLDTFDRLQECSVTNRPFESSLDLAPGRSRWGGEQTRT